MFSFSFFSISLLVCLSVSVYILRLFLICLSSCLPVCLSVCLFGCLPVCIFISVYFHCFAFLGLCFLLLCLAFTSGMTLCLFFFQIFFLLLYLYFIPLSFEYLHPLILVCTCGAGSLYHLFFMPCKLIVQNIFCSDHDLRLFPKTLFSSVAQ